MGELVDILEYVQLKEVPKEVPKGAPREGLNKVHEEVDLQERNNRAPRLVQEKLRR